MGSDVIRFTVAERKVGENKNKETVDEGYCILLLSQLI